jgi:hypothetical protein
LARGQSAESPLLGNYQCARNISTVVTELNELIDTSPQTALLTNAKRLVEGDS